MYRSITIFEAVSTTLSNIQAISKKIYINGDLKDKDTLFYVKLTHKRKKHVNTVDSLIYKIHIDLNIEYKSTNVLFR